MSEIIRPAIEIRNLTKRFGDFTALQSVTFSVRRGEFFSLLGPSGCGKTTVLRIIAGFEFPTEGEVLLGGEDVAKLPAYRRPVNTVFQSYALFPHMSVRQNVAFGLRMKGLERGVIEEKVAGALEMVRISPLAERKPAQLSGGQRQRVALARAVVNEPEVLLLDEPLGALDAKLRKELQGELMSLQRRLGITFICVTHDQEEALVMSDRIAVVNEGRIEQIGDAREMYEHPRTRFVSNFLGTSNIIEARVRQLQESAAIVDSSLGAFRVEYGGASRKSDQTIILAIRPERVLLSTSGGGENTVLVTVREAIYTGSETHYTVDANGHSLIATAVNADSNSRPFAVGQQVCAYFPPGGLIPLDG